MSSSGKHVLITGGTGFVGSWMTQAEWANLKVSKVDHVGYAVDWERLQWDFIFHLAPVSPARVLDYAKEHNTRVLYASSGAALHGTDEYACNKRKWEQECLDSKADVVIARMYSFVGKGLPTRFAIMHFIEQAKAGGPVILEGTGKAVRSYLYGSEMAWWLWYYLFRGQRETVEIGGRTPFTMLDIALMVAQVAGVKFEQRPNPEMKDSVYLPEHGIVEKIKLRDAVERTMNES